MIDGSANEILSDIGIFLKEDIRSETDDAFLYAEAGDNWVSSSLFFDNGDRVIYRHPSSDLDYRILDLWDAAEPDKKWNSISYTVTGGRFHVTFQYEEGWDPDEQDIDRRTRVLEAKYGNKPVDYSDP